MTKQTNVDPLKRNWDLVAFDLDDTLAPSKSSLPPEMGEALRALLDVTQVAVISGGAFAQFELQLLDNLDASSQQLANLHLMPTCGTRYLKFEEGQMVEVYDHPLDDQELADATRALQECASELGLWETAPWGDIIENRFSQVTFSALGQDAPLEAKRNWDPTGEKRAALAEAVQKRLPNLEVRSGGATSVDITARGIDKAYGMDALIAQTGIAKENMLFIGDRLDEGGNDYPVRAAGWPTFAVDSWAETADVVSDVAEKIAFSNGFA